MKNGSKLKTPSLDSSNLLTIRVELKRECFEWHKKNHSISSDLGNGNILLINKKPKNCVLSIVKEFYANVPDGSKSDKGTCSRIKSALNKNIRKIRYFDQTKSLKVEEK